MIPIGGMVLGTGLGVIAEVATQSAHTNNLTAGQKFAMATGFGIVAGFTIAYALNAHQQDAKKKGQLKP